MKGQKISTKRFGNLPIFAVVLKILSIGTIVLTVVVSLVLLLFFFAGGVDLFAFLGFSPTGSALTSFSSVLVTFVIGALTALFLYGGGELVGLLMSMENNTFQTANLLGGKPPIDKHKFRRKWNISYELFLFLLLLVFVIIVGSINPAFFSIGTLFDAIRNQTLYILLGIGLLPVIIIGGFDISFPAVAALSTFFARAILGNLPINGTIWHYYFIAISIGILAGRIIGWTVWRFKLSIFDFSLGVSSMITGLMVLISNIDTNWGRFEGLSGWNMRWLFTVKSVVGRSGLHVSFLIVVAVSILMHLFLRYTSRGRSLYAYGSNRSVAIRTGFDVRKIYLTAFSILGAMSAVASVTGSGFGGGNFSEKYLNVYATVIIGGASVRGGKGSVIGTVLGVMLIGLINQALVYVRVPAAWWDMLLGLLFIAFTTYQTLERRISQ